MVFDDERLDPRPAGRLVDGRPDDDEAFRLDDGAFAAGTVTLNGRKWTFRIPMVQAPAGLYKIADKVANASIQGGWIVYKGGQTGSVTIDGRTGTAPSPSPCSRPSPRLPAPA